MIDTVLDNESNLNKTKFYLMGFLKLSLNLNNTYSPFLKNVAVRNMSGLNVSY